MSPRRRTTSSRSARLPPPVSVASIHHFINQAVPKWWCIAPLPGRSPACGSASEEFRGLGSGAGVAGASPELHVAFFALLWNLDPSTQITLLRATTMANESRATFDYQGDPEEVSPEPHPAFDDRFLGKVVPSAILAKAPLTSRCRIRPTLVASFLSINRDSQVSRTTPPSRSSLTNSAPRILWQGTFKQLANTAVESSFADQRSLYLSRPVDRSTDPPRLRPGVDEPTRRCMRPNSGTIVLAG